MGRLQRADQHGAGRAFLFADEIDAPVDAVGAIDIGKARRAEHHEVARRRPAERMRGRLGVMIGLDLDDDAADAVDQQRRADQVGRDLMHTAGKERAFERLARIGGGLGSGLMLRAISDGNRRVECRASGNMLKHGCQQAERLRFRVKRIS